MLSFVKSDAKRRRLDHSPDQVMLLMDMLEKQADMINDLKITVIALQKKSEKEAERNKDLETAKRELLQLRTEVKALENKWKPQHAWSQINSFVHGTSTFALKGKAPVNQNNPSNCSQGTLNIFIIIILII
jgi:dynactin complex subunit